jgi:outer membrane protein assembly factor BamD (BamD/ComL family)
LVLAPAPTPITTPIPAPTSPPILPATPPASVSDYYAEALDLARQGEHDKAAAMLETAISKPGGPHDLELYQLALLRQRHLNDPRGALDALLAYRKAYPRGSLLQEVDLSVVEVDRALGRTEAALAESARFLAQHPQSERADDVRVLRGDLLRQRGDCTGAVKEYRAVLGGPALDDALYEIAYCRRELGDNAGASAALRDYLARFPSGRHSSAAREALGQ